MSQGRSLLCLQPGSSSCSLDLTCVMCRLEEEAQSRRKVRKEDEDGGPSSSHALAASTSSQFPGLVKVLKLDLLDYVEKYSQPGKKVPPKLDVNSWSQLADLHAGLTVSGTRVGKREGHASVCSACWQTRWPEAAVAGMDIQGSLCPVLLCWVDDLMRCLTLTTHCAGAARRIGAAPHWRAVLSAPAQGAGQLAEHAAG